MIQPGPAAIGEFVVHVRESTVAPRPLSESEIVDVLQSDLVGHLATLDVDGYPHVTPIWFHWDGETVRMTSLPNKPHVHRLRHDARAGFVVDLEARELSDGQRPNRQVRIIGNAALSDDADGDWTRAITHRYLRGPGAQAQAQTRSEQLRVVIELLPTRIIAVASV